MGQGNGGYDMRNAEGYMDLTPWEAERRIEHERRQAKRVSKLMGVIFYVIENAGFRLENRLVLRDVRTDEVFD